MSDIYIPDGYIYYDKIVGGVNLPDHYNLDANINRFEKQLNMRLGGLLVERLPSLDGKAIKIIVSTNITSKPKATFDSPPVIMYQKSINIYVENDI